MDLIEYDIIRERKKLAYGGAISLVVAMEKNTQRTQRRAASDTSKASPASTR